MTKSKKPRCHGKAGYLSEDTAIRVILRASRLRGTALRMYRCEECKQIHLTKRRYWGNVPTVGPVPHRPFTPRDMARLCERRRDTDLQNPIEGDPNA